MAPHESTAPREGQPELSVVIPSFDGAGRLPETLRSIAAQRAAFPFEVVVVDDGSTDGTAEIAARAAFPSGPPRVHRRERPGGRAAALNLGLRSATGAVVLILDDDMTLALGALEAHRSFHAAANGAAALGRIVLAPPPERPSCFTRFLEREEAFRETRLVERARDLPFPLCLTGHFSAARYLLLEAGGFDETIRRYGFEDIELGYRLTERGVRLVYLPEAEAVHRAYMTTLDRYLERHAESGKVARHLARLYPEGPFREYLRLDPAATLGLGRDPAGLALLRLAHRLLLRRPIRRLIGSRPGFGAFRVALKGLEVARLDRLAHFGYHVAADLRYLQGYFGELGPEGP